jgi:uncharacterized membrane protein YiaA
MSKVVRDQMENVHITGIYFSNSRFVTILLILLAAIG